MEFGDVVGFAGKMADGSAPAKAPSLVQKGNVHLRGDAIAPNLEELRNGIGTTTSWRLMPEWARGFLSGTAKASFPERLIEKMVDPTSKDIVITSPEKYTAGAYDAAKAKIDEQLVVLHAAQKSYEYRGGPKGEEEIALSEKLDAHAKELESRSEQLAKLSKAQENVFTTHPNRTMIGTQAAFILPFVVPGLFSLFSHKSSSASSTAAPPQAAPPSADYGAGGNVPTSTTMYSALTGAGAVPGSTSTGYSA